MKKVLLIGCVGLPLVLILALVIAFIAMPSDFDVQSEIQINATPDKIYPLVNTPSRWPEWTVWTKEKYPTMETTYVGEPAGVGAGSTWTEENGNGAMTITSTDPQKGIDYSLEFEGFGESIGHVHFFPDANGTKVTMGLKGNMGGMFKLFLPLMKGAMEEEYAQCLEKLKATVEGS